MDPKTLRDLIAAFCDDVDAGRAPVRRLPPGTVAAMALGLTACAHTGAGEGVGLYGAPIPEAHEEAPMQVVIGTLTPTPKEVCDDGEDNNGDGKVDCDDPTCADQDPCRGPVLLYAAP